MKKLFVAFYLFLFSHLSFSAANDVRVEQRNSENTGWLYRIMPSPSTDGFLTYNTTTIEPEWVTLGSSCSITGNVLDCNGSGSIAWSGVTGTPAWMTTFNGSYSTLSGSAPVTSVQGQSGAITLTPADILAAPASHSHVATAISDSTSVGRSVLTASTQAIARSAIGAGTSNFSGAYTDLTSTPLTFAPSAHNHPSSQINDSTLVGRSVLTAATQADARSAIGAGIPVALTSQLTNDSFFVTSSTLTSGLAGKFNSPSGTTAQYLRGDGSTATFPSIPSAQVNSDWSASSGVAQILNKPVKYSGATNSSGIYAVTYASPYATVPHVVLTVVGGTNKDSAVLTSTVNGFSILVERRSDVLGLLPTYAPVTPSSSPTATVNVTVTP